MNSVRLVTTPAVPPNEALLPPTGIELALDPMWWVLWWWALWLPLPVVEVLANGEKK